MIKNLKADMKHLHIGQVKALLLISCFGILTVLMLNGCKGKTRHDTRDVPLESATQHEPRAESTGVPEATGSGSELDPDSYESMMALQESALGGMLQNVVQLIQAGVNVNAPDSAGRTSLMFAAFNGHTDIVRILLDTGAETEMMDSTGRTALIYCSTGPFPETVELLLERDAGINVADNDENFTALMYAAAEGNLEVVKILLEHGADKTMQDIDGDNAESFARQAGHTAVADFLSKL